MTASRAAGIPTGRPAPEPIRRLAVNSASESENKIHDDAEALKYGYRGGLVPGVTLYAYLTQLAAPYFGPDWLARGVSSVRLLRPVYEGETVVCSAAPGEREGTLSLDLTCAREDGTVCADGAAWLPAAVAADALAGAPDLPDRAPDQPLPRLTPETIPLGVPLAPLDMRFTSEQAHAYAKETADPAPWWRDGSPLGAALLPPGVIAGRQARLLRHNFTFGPSIHVASAITHLAPARADARYRTGGVIRETFERKGNQYLVLDALTTADGVPVARIRHTSIFQVRTV